MRRCSLLAVATLLQTFVAGFSAAPLVVRSKLSRNDDGTSMLMMIATTNTNSRPFVVTTITTSSSSSSSLLVRGGGRRSSTKLEAASGAKDNNNEGSSCPATGVVSIVSSLWGTGGVLYILGKAIKRVLPIALEPFVGVASATKNAVSPPLPLSNIQLG